jgi:hypothetical protein
MAPAPFVLLIGNPSSLLSCNRCRYPSCAAPGAGLDFDSSGSTTALAVKRLQTRNTPGALVDTPGVLRPLKRNEQTPCRLASGEILGTMGLDVEFGTIRGLATRCSQPQVSDNSEDP